MKINDISRQCMRWLCNYLKYMKLINSINFVNGLSIIRNATLTLTLSTEINQISNEQINLINVTVIYNKQQQQPIVTTCVIALSSIRSSRSLDTFKKHLKTHYFKEHFYGIYI